MGKQKSTEQQQQQEHWQLSAEGSIQTPETIQKINVSRQICSLKTLKKVFKQVKQN